MCCNRGKVFCASLYVWIALQMLQDLKISKNIDLHSKSLKKINLIYVLWKFPKSNNTEIKGELPHFLKTYFAQRKHGKLFLTVISWLVCFS